MKAKRCNFPWNKPWPQRWKILKSLKGSLSRSKWANRRRVSRNCRRSRRRRWNRQRLEMFPRWRSPRKMKNQLRKVIGPKRLQVWIERDRRRQILGSATSTPRHLQANSKAHLLWKLSHWPAKLRCLWDRIAVSILRKSQKFIFAST